jgi:hypothetical protein
LFLALAILLWYSHIALNFHNYFLSQDCNWKRRGYIKRLKKVNRKEEEIRKNKGIKIKKRGNERRVYNSR